MEFVLLKKVKYGIKVEGNESQIRSALLEASSKEQVEDKR